MRGTTIAIVPDEKLITCRRCKLDYAVSARAFLPACPQCGASPRGMFPRLRDNRIAAVVATIALITLAVALTMPFMDMTTLGRRREFSLVGGIAQLFDDGHFTIGAILLVFSVLFPIAKLIALLIATSKLANVSLRTRKILHKAADLTGKYSILDVLVVAVLIVLIKFRNIAEVHPRAGVTVFCAAVVLSIIAGLSVSLPSPSTLGEGQGEGSSKQKTA
jgi:paraquat-inducible protein A